jgi:long-subunit acyl-CoA synthetase (AMP-forming)
MSNDVPALALERIYHWEKTRPNDVFFTQPMGGGAVKDYTFKQMMDETRRIAAFLKSLNLPEKSNVALMSKNTAYWIMTDLAIWMAGHVSVPLYPTLNAETVAQILDHSESKLMFVGKLDTWDEMKKGVPGGLRCVAMPLSPKTDFEKWEDLLGKHPPMADSPVRPKGDLATIIYTSGSTGVPKGVMHSFEAMGVSAFGIGRHLGVRQDDRMLSYLPLAHAFERFIVEANSLHYGFHVFFAESLETFVQDLQRARPTLFVSVPRLWLKFQAGVFAKMPPKKLDRLLKIPVVSKIVKKKILKGLGFDAVRFAGSGSAPIPPDVIQWYRDLGLELLEGYGMSENFSYSHVSYPGRARVGYVGEAYPEVQARISAEGEIQVKSPGNMLGYYKAPDLTKEMFTEDGFLKTGDQGEVDDKGRYKITGRVKDLFKTSKGKYVAPAPIENHLMTSEHVEQACCTGVAQPQPHGLLMLSESTRGRMKKNDLSKDVVTKDLEKHLGWVNQQLPQHEQLDFFVVVKEPWLIENGFLTPTMKIKRATLEKHYGPKADGWYSTKQKVIWES